MYILRVTPNSKSPVTEIVPTIPVWLFVLFTEDTELRSRVVKSGVELFIGTKYTNAPVFPSGKAVMSLEGADEDALLLSVTVPP